METREQSFGSQNSEGQKTPTVELRTGKERRIALPITIVLLILTLLVARGFLDSSGVDEEGLNNSPVTLHVDGEDVTVDGQLASDAFAQLPTITELAGVELDYDPADFSSPGPSDEFIEARRAQNASESTQDAPPVPAPTPDINALPTITPEQGAYSVGPTEEFIEERQSQSGQ